MLLLPLLIDFAGSNPVAVKRGAELVLGNVEIILGGIVRHQVSAAGASDLDGSHPQLRDLKARAAELFHVSTLNTLYDTRLAAWCQSKEANLYRHRQFRGIL